MTVSRHPITMLDGQTDRHDGSVEVQEWKENLSFTFYSSLITYHTIKETQLSFRTGEIVSEQSDQI